MGTVVPRRLGRAAAQRTVRLLAADSGRVVLTRHAMLRMRQRGVGRAEVMAALRQGFVIDDPSRDIHGNWTCRIRRFAAGREMTLAVAIEWEANVIVITVFGD
jgi:hypothetical protein